MTRSNSTNHDILLGEYTLGLLNASETAQAHALLGKDQQAVATALAWEHRLLELTDLLAPVDPSPLLLQRIQSSLGHDMAPTPASLYRKPDPAPSAAAARNATAAAASPGAAPAGARSALASASPAPATAIPPKGERPRTEPALSQGYLDRIQQPPAQEPAPESISNVTEEPRRARPEAHGVKAAPQPQQSGTHHGKHEKKEKRGNIWFWRLTTLGFAAAALVLALIPSEPVPPPVTIVQVAPTQAAILQAPGQSSTPAWVVTVDPEHNVLMNPRVRSDIPADASVQLWTHSKSMPAPRSLGLIDPNQPVTVPASLMGTLSPEQIFEMTLEPKGGSPTASPSGPVLFIGRMVTFGAQAQPQPDPAAPPEGT